MKFKPNNQICSVLKIATQSMLNKAHVIKTPKKQRHVQMILRKQEIAWLFIVQGNVPIGKKQKMVKIYFLKLFLIDFC